jgi:circadian clock protein KaiC
MERLSTGNADLDRILGGGLMPGSLVVLAGAPGTGKTILAQQMCFRNASPEHPAIYYTTMSEPHTKMIRHLSSFDFFDTEKLGTDLQMQNLAALVNGDLSLIVDEVVREAFASSPSIVVIDSAKSLHDAARNVDFRQVVHDLAAKVSHTDAVLVLVGEYSTTDIAMQPEFAVADVIITLGNDPVGAFDERSLRVVKMRGSDYLSGVHAFRLDGAGFRIFPRVESILPPPAEFQPDRVSTGIAGLDEMMKGGPNRGAVALVPGPSGAGKTVLAISFLVEGIARGERCLFVALEESASQVITKARGFGWDLHPAIATGQLTILERQPVELGLDAVGSAILGAVADGPVSRVVIDSMGELEHAARGASRFADYLWSLLGHIRGHGATVLVTSETSAFFGPAFELVRGLSYIVDDVVLLRYTEVDGDIRRALAVVKMRGSDHTKSLVEFEIGPKGIVVKGKFAGLSGVLTGTPSRAEERFKEFFNK